MALIPMHRQWNHILQLKIRERNVVRKKAAVSGKERCVTRLKTAAKETRAGQKTPENFVSGSSTKI